MRHYTRIMYFIGLLFSSLIFSPVFADIQGIAMLFPASQVLPPSFYPVYVVPSSGTAQQITDVSSNTSPLPYVASVGYVPFSGSSQTLTFYQVTSPPAGTSTSATNAGTCSLVVNADGSVTSNTCTGVVRDNTSSTSSVTVLDMPSQIFVSQPGTLPDPLPTVINNTARALTFVNQTSYDLCLNSNSNYSDPNQTNCSAPGDYIMSQGGTPLNYAIPSAGKNSGAFIIVGFRLPGTTAWTSVGQSVVNSNNYDYASKIEGTFYPQTAGVTTGVSNVDISLVDGYNFAVTYYPTQSATSTGGICASGQDGFVFYSSTHPMSQVPVSGVNLASICPANQQISDGSGNSGVIGCYSSCTYNTFTYGVGSSQAQQACCTGAYSTQATCSPVQSQFPYVTNIHNYTINGYAYAYDDNRADFSCDQNLGFTYVISNIGSIPTPPPPPPPTAPVLSGTYIHPNTNQLTVCVSQAPSPASGSFSATIPGNSATGINWNLPTAPNKFIVITKMPLFPNKTTISISVTANGQTKSSNSIPINNNSGCN